MSVEQGSQSCRISWTQFRSWTINSFHYFLAAFFSCLAAYLIDHPISPATNIRDFIAAAFTTAIGGALVGFVHRYLPDNRDEAVKAEEPKQQ